MSELYVSFLNLAWFNNVDNVYVIGEEGYQNESMEFFKDLAEESGKVGWPFAPNGPMFNFNLINKKDFAEFDTNSLLPEDFLTLEEDPSTFAQEQCILMHFMILTEAMGRYVSHITNAQNK
jgi:hypothetical protein